MPEPSSHVRKSCATSGSPDAFVDDNTLTVNINRLRKTLASIGIADDFLQTRRSLGYVIMA